MPELPEVETVRQTLRAQIQNRVITNFKCYVPRLILGRDEKDFDVILGLRIEEVLRVGKYLIFVLGPYSLVCHLRMEGKYFIKPTGTSKDKHEHVIFSLDNEMDLRYSDTRKFGTIELLKTADLYTSKPLCSLGVEPNTENFTLSYLKGICKTNSTIKGVLLDQRLICGIGNIYANEICFSASVFPKRPANTLSEIELKKIHEATNTILSLAIECGGTTIRSYTSSLGVTGRFQQKLLVHGKKGESCLLCQGSIEKITVAGRGTYYCPNCQK